MLPTPPVLQFTSSAQYWEDRYARGGNSGAGSYGRLAQFKADMINDFVAKNAVATVVEFGCGDGAQLELAKYPHYIGIDISEQAISLCRSKFRNDSNKRFVHALCPEARGACAELAISLDVIYHLLEDDVYETYMRQLVKAATKFICIYSSNVERESPAPHIRHRRFSDWLEMHAPQWTLMRKALNPYPEDHARPEDTSWADFYFFNI